MGRGSLILRGVAQVAPVGASQVACAHAGVAMARGAAPEAVAAWAAVAVVGFWISFVWWINAGSAARSSSWADAAAYGLGAAVGLVSGGLAASVLLR